MRGGAWCSLLRGVLVELLATVERARQLREEGYDVEQLAKHVRGGAEQLVWEFEVEQFRKQVRS